MKNLRSFSLAFLLIAFVMYSCKKEDNSSPTSGQSQITSSAQYQSGNQILGHFIGKITDSSGQAIADVTVSIANQSTSTDADGFYTIENALVDSKRAYVKASKSGYFHGSDIIRPSANGFNRVDVQLLNKVIVGSVQSSIGGTVSLSDGSSVSLPADGIVTEFGQPYSGQVDVALHHIDPSVDGWNAEMPGDLTALNAGNDYGALMSFGMLVVELTAADGTALQLASGSNADLTFPVANDMLANAPATIALWYFDEEEGVWKEEGEATLVGNNYVGQVSHFSFWNCDVFDSVVSLDGAVVDPQGNPVQSAYFQITTLNGNTGGLFSGGMSLQADGSFAGDVPTDTEFLIQIFSEPCQELLYSATVGPYNDNVTLDDIVVSSTTNLVSLSGTLVDCDLNALGGGSLFITSVEGLYQSAVGLDGGFSITIPDCGASFPIDLNLMLNQSGTILLLPVSIDSYGDLGDIIFCDNVIECGAASSEDEYFSMCFIPNSESVPIESFYYTQETASISGHMDSYFSIFGNVGGSPIIQIENNLQTNGVGTYPVMEPDYFSISVVNTQDGFPEGFVTHSHNGSITFEEYASEVGEYWEGSMTVNCQASGISYAETGMLVGSFRIRKN